MNPSQPRLPDLPVASAFPALSQGLSERHAVLSAPPGSGKSTLVPLLLLEQPWLAGQRIVMLEPRRVAARACAARMAHLLGERPGQTVGYQVRLDRCIGPQTRIEVVTEGILTRRLQADPELAGVGLLIFDEFHERNLQADLSLALALDTASALRDDLRLLLMSAMLDSDRLCTLLADAEPVQADGRLHPVEVRYRPIDRDGPLLPALAKALLAVLRESEGDVLVFLPGVGEIRGLANQLEGLSDELRLLQLHGQLDAAQQDAVLRPDGDATRRVILATDIAETSLTIEGVGVVVDSGLCRKPLFDPRSGLTRLTTQWISRASAEQRAGRAGRLGPGVCYRLWDEARHARLEAHIQPEILQADLAPLALELANWGVADPAGLRWLDPPPDAAFGQAQRLLQSLQALDGNGRITARGRKMVGGGLHPRLSHMLAEAARFDAVALAADIAALLEERDPLRGQDADLPRRLQWLEEARAGRPRGPERALLGRIEQLARGLRGKAGGGRDADPGALLSLAYPERIAQRVGEQGQFARYRLANGRGALLSLTDPLAGCDWLAVASMDAGQRDGRIYLAAPITIDQIRQLHGDRIQRADEVRWDSREQRVLAQQVERLDALLLSQRALPNPAPERVKQALLEGIAESGLAVLPWDASAQQLRARIDFVRRHDSQWQWPDMTDEALLASLADWLGPWLDGIGRLDQLRRLDLPQALLAMLDWTAQKRLDTLAPTHLTVPSGSRLRLDYRDEVPVLKVRLQEMFGLAETPAVCGGRVPLVLHLLSPAQRPVQVTRDLRGFWDNTYQEVKKELKGRYPKHHWPDDPWSAQATARAKPRR